MGLGYYFCFFVPLGKHPPFGTPHKQKGPHINVNTYVCMAVHGKERSTVT